MAIMVFRVSTGDSAESTDQIRTNIEINVELIKTLKF